MRGVAAVAVANFHFFCAFVPVLVSEYSASPSWVSDTPLAILYNGGFAVAIFFVLSGFVIADSAAKRDVPVWFNLIQRYFRLAVPVLASVLLAYLLLAAFADSLHRLQHSNGSEWLNLSYGSPLPGPLTAVKEALLRTFLHGSTYFNNALWTMQIELIGSCIIYLVYSVRNRQWRIRALALGLAATSGAGLYEYASFFAGALMREAVLSGRLPTMLPGPALVSGVILGAMMEGWGERVLGAAAPRLLTQDPVYAFGAPHGFWHFAGSVLIIYAILNLENLRRILSTRLCRFLGDISFGFYLVHVPIIYTVVGALYVAAPQAEASRLVLIYVAFMAISIPLGHGFAQHVDGRVTKAIKRAKQLVAASARPDADPVNPLS